MISAARTQYGGSTAKRLSYNSRSQSPSVSPHNVPGPKWETKYSRQDIGILTARRLRDEWRIHKGPSLLSGGVLAFGHRPT